MPVSRSLLLLAAVGLLASPAVAADPGREAIARKLINSQGCKACHSLEGAGGEAAPDLDTAGQRLSAAELRRQLVNPEHRHGDGRIPDFHHLAPAEIDAIVSFLKRQAEP